MVGFIPADLKILAPLNSVATNAGFETRATPDLLRPWRSRCGLSMVWSSYQLALGSRWGHMV